MYRLTEQRDQIFFLIAFTKAVEASRGSILQNSTALAFTT